MLSAITSNLTDLVFTGGIALGLILSIIALIAALIAAGRSKRLRNRYRSLMKGESGKDLESLVNQYNEKVTVLEKEVARLTEVLGDHEVRITRKLGTAQVVRYNAFGEKGNDLSFSIALLDEEGSGTVLSSIFGRDESRVYAKPVSAKGSIYTLTDEEKDVIEKKHK